MNSTLFILLLVIAVSAWLLLRRKAERAAAVKMPSKEELAKSSKYHAVAIKPGVEACDAAKSMAGQRFLSKEAPQLPLPECGSMRCACQFTHYADRRSRQDRRSPFGSGRFVANTGEFEAERRIRPDRRNASQEEEFWAQ